MKKLKEKVQEVAKQVAEETEKDLVREVVPCELYDQNCIETAKSEGKKVVITNESVVTSGSNETSIPENSALKNQFEENTRVQVIGHFNNTNNYVISEDGSYVAIPGFAGSRQTIFINGKEEDLAFDKVHFKSFKFGSTGGRYAYIASNGGDNFAVINGKISGKIPPVNLINSDKILTISKDGENVSYFQRREDGTTTLVINGEEINNIQILDSDQFYLRRKKIYYIATPYQGVKQNPNDTTTRYHLYINNKPGIAYRGMSNLKVSDDGEHYAYQASKMVSEGKFQGHLVLNGKAGAPYPKIENLTMDPLTGAIFYVGVSEERLTGEKGFYRNYYEADFIFNERKYKRSETGMVRPSEIAFSPNGKRHA
ncbi:MAG: hypothetical protein WD512_04270, partial [Candidatus Paceibacterota bacterium]